MNKIWLKIIGLVVLALVMIVAVYVLWPAETAPMAEPVDVELTPMKSSKSNDKISVATFFLF